MKRLLDLIHRVPGLQQLLLLLGIAAAVAIGIGIYMELRSPDYATVVAGAPDAEAAQITQALQQAGIAYRVDAMGDVQVPSADATNARMTLGAKNLPAAPFGMQSLTETSGFGISQFMEHTRYNYALENDLARNVGNVQGVAHAYVHLAIPQPSAFVDATDTPSASVMVELAPGAMLEPSQVSAITHMVAASVPGLQASRVTIVDQSGQLLSDAATQSALGQTAGQMQLTREFEHGVDNKIVALLTPLVGVGDVRVQTSADIDYATPNEADETYHPDPKAIRSQTVASDGGAATLPQGVPGAFSNQPRPAAPPPGTQPVAATTAGAPPAPSSAAPRSTSESTQYAISRSIEHIAGVPGQLKRMAVAVLVSEPSTSAAAKTKAGKSGTAAPGFTAAQLANMTALVKSAAGYNAARGDIVTVVAAPFTVHDEPALGPAGGPAWWNGPWLVPLVRDVLAALAILVIGLMVIRPAIRTLLIGQGPVATVADAVAEIRHAAHHPPATSSPPGMTAEPNYDDKLNIAHTAVAQDPKRVAQVMKTWVNGND